MPQPEHGTSGAYIDGRCRCADCRSAWRIYMRNWRDKAAARVQRGELVIPHGTAGGYTNYRCRCDKCCDAARAYELSRPRRGTA